MPQQIMSVKWVLYYVVYVIILAFLRKVCCFTEGFFSLTIYEFSVFFISVWSHGYGREVFRSSEVHSFQCSGCT